MDSFLESWISAGVTRGSSETLSTSSTSSLSVKKKKEIILGTYNIIQEMDSWSSKVIVSRGKMSLVVQLNHH